MYTFHTFLAEHLSFNIILIITVTFIMFCNYYFAINYTFFSAYFSR